MGIISHVDVAAIDLASGSLVRGSLARILGEGDNMANIFGVEVLQNGEPVNLSGCSVVGYFIRSNGDTVMISGGTVSGNVATITLPQSCYVYEGRFSLAIKLIGGGVTGTMRVIDGTVANTTTNALVDPGHVIPDISELLEQIERMEAATAAAESAALKINGAVDGFENEQKNTQWANGSWRNSTTNTPELTSLTNRVRPQKWIPVYRGETIRVLNGEDYVHAVGLWKGWLGSAEKVRADDEFVLTDEEINVTDDGFAIVSFADKDDQSIDISPVNFDGAVSVCSYAKGLLPVIDGIREGEMDGLRHVRHFVNGTWVDNGPLVTFDKTRIRPSDFLFVKKGDVIRITNGSCYHAVGIWSGTLASHTQIRSDLTFVHTDETINVTSDGFFIVSFALASNQSAGLDVNAFDGAVTISSYAMRLDAKLEEAIGDLGHGTEKYLNTSLKFQGGNYTESGSLVEYATGMTKASIPHLISGTEVDEIVIHNGYNASFLMFRGETYLGKIRPDGALDKVSGNWKLFTGTVKVAELLETYQADGFKMNVNLLSGSLAKYEEAYNLNCCDFITYTKPEGMKAVETVELSNGSWKNAAYAMFSLTIAASRLRPRNIVPVSPGDVIKINTDGGKYYGAYVLWDGYPGHPSKVPNHEIVFYEDQTIRVAFSGFYMQSFGLSADHSATLNLEDFTGGIEIIRNSMPDDIIQKNIMAMKIAIGSQRNFTNTSTANIPGNNLASFVHVTDVHGDRKALKAAYKVAEYLDADALIASGDMVYYYSNDDFSYVIDAVDGDTDFLMCIGNHDAFQLNAAEQKAKYITPFATKFGYQVDGSATNATWYYKDYASKKLRVIVVNQFEYDGRTTGDTRMNFTQAQVNWIQNTLLSTPANYGLLIVMHTPEKTPVKNAGYPKFYQDKLLYSDTSNPGMTILTELVDAFISRGTLSKTFSNRSGATPGSVTVNADFSSVNNGVEFIAFVNGHFHSDHVSYVSGTTNMQLQLNAVQSNSWYGMCKGGYSGNDNPWLTELSDLQRIAMTPTEESFNVFTIDRESKTVRVTRIGSNVPSDMKEIRDFMVIPYAAAD